MGKKKEKTPNSVQIANKDILHRMNYLYQASLFMQSLDSSRSTASHSSSQPACLDDKRNQTTNLSNRKRASRQTRQPADISRFMVSSLRTISRKTVIPIHPTIKRSLCKGCQSILIPGVTSRVRIKNSKTHDHTISTTCLRCQLTKNIPYPPLPSRETRLADASNPAQIMFPQTSVPDNTRVVNDIEMSSPAEIPIFFSRSARKRQKKNARLPPLTLREDQASFFKTQ